MPTAASDPAALAEAHRIAQLRESAKVEAALAALWRRTIDPDDFERTFVLFREQALPLLQAGISRSQGVADAYLASLYEAKGLPAPPITALRPVDESYLRGRIGLGAQSIYTASALRRGGDPDALMKAALAGMVGQAKGTMLNAGRQRVQTLGSRDTRRFARVSDGKPCSFCAMLISRGPVYTAATADFRAHAAPRGGTCGCSVRPVLPGDADRGWTPEARRFRAIWNDVAEGDSTAFRRVLSGRPVDARLGTPTKYGEDLLARWTRFQEAEADVDEFRPRRFENLAALIALLTLRGQTAALPA